MALVGVLAFAGSALAMPVTYQVSNVKVYTVSGGLSLQVDTSVLDTSPFVLDDGDSQKFDAFDVGTNLTTITPGNGFWQPVFAEFEFASSSTTAPVLGLARGFWRFNTGTIFWASTFVQADNTIFKMSLDPTKFSAPGMDRVYADVEQISSWGTATPEPGALLLFLVGAAVVARSTRRA